jgi:phosphoribosylformylglycinamidine synthase
MVSGAEPLGLTDGLNFGSPERPEGYWQLVKAVKGVAAACEALEIPVTGGNASLYNETNGEPIFPTPVIGMVGLITDLERRCRVGFSGPGQVVMQLGETLPEVGGSEYLRLRTGKVAGAAPSLDLEREKALLAVARVAIEEGLVTAAHDVSEGGLLVALAEMCLEGRVGCGIAVEPTMRLDAFLFGESQSRILVAVAPERVAQVAALADEAGLPWSVLGATGGDGLKVWRAGDETTPVAVVGLAEMERVYRDAIPRRLEGRERV